MQQFLKIKNQL